VHRLSNRAVDAVEPHLGWLAQAVDFALETERLVAVREGVTGGVVTGKGYYLRSFENVIAQMLLSLDRAR
jgi:hypothetical protein